MTPFDCLIRAVTWRWRLQSDQCSWNALGRVTRVCRLNREGVSAAVTGLRSRPFSSVMTCGGAYVLGGPKTCQGRTARVELTDPNR